MRIFFRLDLLICSFLINVLVLAIPLYVIHALTRFLANGSYPTLYFLTFSVIFAITLELLLRYLRKLLLLINNKKKIIGNETNIKEFLDDVSKIKVDLLVFNSILDHFKNFKNNNIEKQINLLDLPYVFLFSVVIYFLSPTVFLVFLLTAIIISILSFYKYINLNYKKNYIIKKNKSNTEDENFISNNFLNINSNNNLIYVLDKFVEKKISEFKSVIDTESSTNNWNYLQSFITSLVIIFVIMVSLIEINEGEMQIANMIALNILVVRSLGPIWNVPNIIAYSIKTKDENLFAKTKFNTNQVNFNNKIESLKLINISCLYENMHKFIFKDFSFEFKKGTLTVVSGENGSGKTSLFNIINHSILPQTGIIEMNNINVDDLKFTDFKNKITSFPQTPFFKKETFVEYLKSFRKKITLEEINNIIVECDLKTFFSQFQNGINLDLSENNNILSLGIKKRVLLAKALLEESDLIILDDPTEGVDLKLAKRMYKYLYDEKNKGKILIIFSRDTNIINGADFIINLEKGQIPKLIKS